MFVNIINMSDHGPYSSFFRGADALNGQDMRKEI